MKGFIFGLLALASTSAMAASNMHPASNFVQDTLARGKQILQNKSETYRRTQICSLLKTRIHSGYIASVWLGDFRRLERDRAGVTAFTNLIPSILVTKFTQGIGGNNPSGGFSVSPEATARGNGYFNVDVTIQTNDGTYNGVAVVLQSKGGFRFVDIEYMGYSAVNYMARDYQTMLNEEYQRDPNGSRPVTAVVQRITNDNDFVRCP